MATITCIVKYFFHGDLELTINQRFGNLIARLPEGHLKKTVE